MPLKKKKQSQSSLWHLCISTGNLDGHLVFMVCPGLQERRDAAGWLQRSGALCEVGGHMQPTNCNPTPGTSCRACTSSSIPAFDMGHVVTGTAPHRCVLEQLCNTSAGACQNQEQLKAFAKPWVSLRQGCGYCKPKEAAGRWQEGHSNLR